jgi:hypothetical protein
MKVSLKLRLYAYTLRIPAARRDELVIMAQAAAERFAQHRDTQILADEVIGRATKFSEVRFLCHAIDQSLSSRFNSPYRARAMIFMDLLNRCSAMVRKTAVPTINDATGSTVIDEGKLNSEHGVEIRTNVKQLCEALATKVMADLQNMDELGFGEDTGLANLWEEICVQRQRGESEVWDAYEETVRLLLEAHVEDLSDLERGAIWLETDQGFDWQCGDECEQGFEPPISERDIVEYIAGRYVYRTADEFSNDRIAAFLSSSLDS